MAMLIFSDPLIRFFEWISRMKIGAIALFPFIIMPRTGSVDPVLLNHEKIHLRQQLELLIIPFYIWYLIAFLRKGYLNISFEKEAYLNAKDLSYLKRRRLWAFRSYL